MSIAKDLGSAQHLADLADEITQRHFSPDGVPHRKKPDGSLVTRADVEVEETLRDAVARFLPNDAFLGEEVGAIGDGPRRWIVDGIDGTTAFARGGPNWGTLVALEEADEITVGICSSPLMGQRWWAARGEGAWLRETVPDAESRVRRLEVSPRRALDGASATILPPVGRTRGWRRDVVQRIGTMCGFSGKGGHPALLVAAGAVDVGLLLNGASWDNAACVVIVEEAGGRFADLWGGRRIDTMTALFTNASLMDATLALVQESVPSSPEASS